MTTDIPALLRRAAARLDELAAPLPIERWTAERMFWKLGSTRHVRDGWWWEVRDADGTVAMVSEEDDDPDGDTAEGRANWLIALGPQVATPLASWLRSTADDAEQVEWQNARADELADRTGSDYTRVLHHAATAHAVTFARALLGEET